MRFADFPQQIPGAPINSGSGGGQGPLLFRRGWVLRDVEETPLKAPTSLLVLSLRDKRWAR